MNDQTSLESRESYFARSQSWAADREKTATLSRRAAWLIAGIAAGIAMLEAVALAMLVPLKSVVPYTVLVDRHTGYVEVLKGAGPDTIAADAALTQALLAQYVIAREGFDISSLRADYRKVALWSADRARSDYLSVMQPSSPSNPLRRYARTALVSVRVKSVSPLGPNLSMVRFDTERRDQGAAATSIQPWAAVLRYRFIGAPMALEDRLINPLGFQVVHYRRDQEALSPELPSLTASVAEPRSASTPPFAEVRRQ